MELRGLIDLAAGLGAPQETIMILEDNSPAIYLSAGEKDTQKSQPFRRLQFFVEHEIDNLLVWLNKVPSEHDFSGIFTKSMHSAREFSRLLGVFKCCKRCSERNLYCLGGRSLPCVWTRILWWDQMLGERQ